MYLDFKLLSVTGKISFPSHSVAQGTYFIITLFMLHLCLC